MRIPVGVSLESRDGTLTRDAKVVNALIEQHGVDPGTGAPIFKVRKRPGVSDLGLVKAGKAQLLYTWNGIKTVQGDYLNAGTVTTIISGPTQTSLTPTNANLPFTAQETGPGAATPRMMFKNRSQAWTVNRAGTVASVTYGGSMGSATYNVSSLTRVGTVATATLPTDPGWTIGDSVTVAGAGQAAYNGAVTVTATTPGTPSSNVALTITRSGTTATATTVGGVPHGLTNGSTYTISGANESAYNGAFAVTVTDSTHFTFTVSVTTYSAISAAATWNPSDKDATLTLSSGNLKATINSTPANYGAVRATVSKASGKWSWEVTASNSGLLVSMGIANATMPLTDYVGQDANSWGYDGQGYTWHSAANTAAATFATNDIIGVKLDMDGGTVQFFKNGASVGSYSGITGTIFPALSLHYNTSAATANFGGTAFTYNYDDPLSPATGAPIVTIPAVNATFSYTVAGSPATPATGTITAQGSGGTVPGIPYIDGYFCVMDSNGVVWNSAQDDPTTWGALSFFTAQNEAGGGKALTKSVNYLIALKDWTAEFYYDAKNATGSPFSPVDPGFVRVGCASGDSLAEVDGLPTWISQVRSQPGRSVHVLQGLSPTKISTPDVERVLNADDLATVYAMGLKIDGHALYLVTLVTSAITLAFDFASKMWMQWTSLTLGSSKSVTSITLSDVIATVTVTAHGLSDGDPVKISGATQTQYNGIFPAVVIDANTFQIQVAGSPATPATGTILMFPYTESYFNLTKVASYQGQSYLLHETNGHLYQVATSLHQDAGVPINTFGRTTRLDGGTLNRKKMSKVRIIGDCVNDSILLRWSDDDCVTFAGFRQIDLSSDQPETRKCGAFKRRTLEFRHTGNNALNLSAIEPEIG